MDDDDRWPEPDIKRLTDLGFNSEQAWIIVKRRAELDEALQVAAAEERLKREKPDHYPDHII